MITIRGKFGKSYKKSILPGVEEKALKYSCRFIRLFSIGGCEPPESVYADVDQVRFSIQEPVFFQLGFLVIFET